MQLATLQRRFEFHGAILADPNPSISIASAQEILAIQYPELSNAKIHVEEKGETQTVRFTVPVGTKG